MNEYTPGSDWEHPDAVKKIAHSILLGLQIYWNGIWSCDLRINAPPFELSSPILGGHPILSLSLFGVSIQKSFNLEQSYNLGPISQNTKIHL